MRARQELSLVCMERLGNVKTFLVSYGGWILLGIVTIVAMPQPISSDGAEVQQILVDGKKRWRVYMSGDKRSFSSHTFITRRYDHSRRRIEVQQYQTYFPLFYFWQSRQTNYEFQSDLSNGRWEVVEKDSFRHIGTFEITREFWEE